MGAEVSMGTIEDKDARQPGPATQADTGLSGPGPVPEGDAEAFNRGMTRGREVAEAARRQLAAWAEENPGQVLLAGLAIGFVLGKLLFPPRRPERRERLDD